MNSYDDTGSDLRDNLEVDVIIVGAGPAGLAAAIRIRQLAIKSEYPDLSVMIVEKAPVVGAHSLSGAVMDPMGLDHLLPNWREEQALTKTRVNKEKLVYLGPAGALRIPNLWMPSLMKNHNNYIISLGQLCRWLSQEAERLGVEIYPGFAATEILYNEAGTVIGVATGDMGISQSGQPKESFQRGIKLTARYTFVAEGARGSIAKQIINRYGLAKERSPQKYGIGLKELWQLNVEQHQPGLVQHTLGWPLDNRTGGGSFIYHWGQQLASIGFVVHLDYKNPYLSPYEEFQRFKTHPTIAPMLKGAERISYGARAITEGGWQSVPKLCFPGGVLLGCAAGFVNVPRIKGIHNALLSGKLAAEHAFSALIKGRKRDELISYEQAWRDSSIGRDLKPVRNVKPLWSRFGTRLGIVLSGLDIWTNMIGFSLFGTLGHSKYDHEALEPAQRHHPILYPKPDGILMFDLASSVYLSNTNHEEDQPCHLKIMDMNLQHKIDYGLYAGLSSRYCPAGVYEWIEKDRSQAQLIIHASNCIHCKTCDIKDPAQNITWEPPEGGEGPVYTTM